MMNGARARNGYDYDTGRGSPGPVGRTLVEAYRKDMVSRPVKEMDSYRAPQGSSALADMKDPIQVHLLTETALSDSTEYEILSQEEVDNLKKKIQILTKRGEQTRANLAIQTKYRDAAISMSKLYSPAGGRTRSPLDDGNVGRDDARQAELEREASERRCEELASELLSVEKRLVDSKTRLLQHTAGILQKTHRASSKKKSQQSNAQALPNGIPGSPESLYTTNGRDSPEMAGDDLYFDDRRSLYFPLDQIDGQAFRPRKNLIEIPLKSPIREQHTQLREEADRLREENGRLNAEAEFLRKESADRIQLIVDTENKLEDLANKLRDAAVGLDVYPNGLDHGSEPGSTVGKQLDYLERGLTAALEDRERGLSQERKETEMAAKTLDDAEGKIETLNRQILGVLRNTEPDYPSPPEASGSGLDEQLGYLQDSFSTIQTELSRAYELSSATSVNKQKNDQIEAVLMGLWDIIQAGYAEIYQQKAERRKARAEKGLEEDEDDMSSDESPMSTGEPYTLQAFSTKVQWLYAQATSLKEQKSVLKRQIKQQRELNNKSSSERDDELRQKTDELQSIRSLLESTEKEATDAQDKLAKTLSDLDTLQRTSSANEATAAQVAQDQLRERDSRIASLESSGKDLQAKLSDLEASVAATQAQLAQASEAKAVADAEIEKLQAEVKEKDDEIDRMNAMVVELKTEVTIAKAELEGAYGSRAQRAAEAAALNKQSEQSELAQQVNKLKAELASVLKELEDITKETISAEKEKLELEGKLDDALAAKTTLESEVKILNEKFDNEVSKLKDQLDAEKLRVPPSPGGMASQPRAGATMLSEQFRATMKEERRKFQEELREEQGKRRKLEDELRALKKAQGPGRSPLSPLSPR